MSYPRWRQNWQTWVWDVLSGILAAALFVAVIAFVLMLAFGLPGCTFDKMFNVDLRREQCDCPCHREPGLYDEGGERMDAEPLWSVSRAALD